MLQLNITVRGTMYAQNVEVLAKYIILARIVVIRIINLQMIGVIVLSVKAMVNIKEANRCMTSKEKLQALVKLMEDEDNAINLEDITQITFPKDGRALVWHDGNVLQVPKWKLEEALNSETTN
jgi:hypothetical protein